MRVKSGKQLLQPAAILAAVAFAAFLTACKVAAPEDVVERDLQGEPEHGKTLIFANGCVACHTVPGVAGDPVYIGPPLTNWSQRKYIAGNLPNDPDQLIRWILNPQEIEPGTAMPDLGLTESEARDIAAYLYSL